MRACLTLLRVFYQLQMGPIFGWGFLLGGGGWGSPHRIWNSLAVFLLFHIGACGGATALNSCYDRDQGPVGGLWRPPPVPRHLLLFAWAIQLAGLVLLLPLGWELSLIYALALVLSFGYSHPYLRWKTDPLKSLLVVCLGQGALSFALGEITAGKFSIFAGSAAQQWSLAYGAVGAMSFVAAFYPLTQLYQIESDTRKGEQSLASWLQNHFGRNGIFLMSAGFFLLGGICNGLAARGSSLVGGGSFHVLLALGGGAFLFSWRNAVPDQRHDFVQVHRLLRLSAGGLGAYILAQLMLTVK